MTPSIKSFFTTSMYIYIRNKLWQNLQLQQNVNQISFPLNIALEYSTTDAVLLDGKGPKNCEGYEALIDFVPENEKIIGDSAIIGTDELANGKEACSTS